MAELENQIPSGAAGSFLTPNEHFLARLVFYPSLSNVHQSGKERERKHEALFNILDSLTMRFLFLGILKDIFRQGCRGIVLFQHYGRARKRSSVRG